MLRNGSILNFTRIIFQDQNLTKRYFNTICSTIILSTLPIRRFSGFSKAITLVDQELKLPKCENKKKNMQTKKNHKKKSQNKLQGKMGGFADTLMFKSLVKPSIWLSSSNIVRWVSRSPLLSLSKRRDPMASSSSMKMIAGSFSFANLKASRTIFAPSPVDEQQSQTVELCLRGGKDHNHQL